MNNGVSDRQVAFSSTKSREQRHTSEPFFKRASLLAALLLPCILLSCLVEACDPPSFVSSKPGGPEDLFVVQNGSAYRLNGSSGKVTWQDHLSVSGQPGNAQMQVVGGVVYVMFNFDVYALDAQNGQQIWHVLNPASQAYFRLLVDSGHVYLYSLDSTFSGLNASNGSTLWHNTTFITTNGTLASVGDDNLYLPDGNKFVALDGATGQLLWSTPLGEGSSFVFQDPLVNNGVVYFALGNLLSAFNSQDGERIWTQRIPAEGSFAAAFLSNGILYVTNVTPTPVADVRSADAASFFAYSAGTGQLLWTSRPADRLLPNFPITNDLLLVLRGSSLAGLDPNTGRTVWQVPIQCAGAQTINCDIVWTQVSGGQLETLGSSYSLQDQFFYTFNKFDPGTGQLLSKQQLAVPQKNGGGNGGAIGTSNGLFYFQIALPQIANNIPYANESFAAYHLSDGSLAWSHTMPPFPPPTSANVAPDTSGPVLAP